MQEGLAISIKPMAAFEKVFRAFAIFGIVNIQAFLMLAGCLLYRIASRELQQARQGVNCCLFDIVSTVYLAARPVVWGPRMFRPRRQKIRLGVRS